MADHKTQPLKQIAIDYNPENCTHNTNTNTITVTYDRRGDGSCWRSTTRFLYGTFSALIQCSRGNTTGLCFNLYLSSQEGNKEQDEIDFEILGKDMTVVETNYYSNGVGEHEESHELGFDSSEGFHRYLIKWSKDVIEWFIDGKMVRRVNRKEGKGFPCRPMFLYSSVWNASKIDKGRWAGKYVGCDEPYVCVYKDIRVPLESASSSSSSISSSMANLALHNKTQTLKKIVVDYAPENCKHYIDTDTVKVTFDKRGGSRWRSPERFLYGTFSALIKCPSGNTSGLNFNFYLSSLEGDETQDGINFEIVGKNMSVAETDYYSKGKGNNEGFHKLGFNSSEGFHKYLINWRKDVMEWFVDEKMVRRVTRQEGKGFPCKAMYLYSSIWDASGVANGSWAGKYVGCDAPYVCYYKDIQVPLN